MPSGTHQLPALLYGLQRILTRALEHNVLVLPVLWDGAAEDVVTVERMMQNEDDLQEYLTILGHVVRALRQYPSLGESFFFSFGLSYCFSLFVMVILRLFPHCMLICERFRISNMYGLIIDS